MRIISGKHKGRKIEFPQEVADKIRPTSEFAREAIFNILTHGKHGVNGNGFADKVVLDLFCGTGAFGVEALSRGAKSVMFIDQAREAIATARYNVENIGESAQAMFMQANAAQLSKSRQSYDVIFIDPPYFSKLIMPTLKCLHAGGWIAEGGVVIIEHDEKEEVAIPPAYEKIDERHYGRALIQLLKIN